MPVPHEGSRHRCLCGGHVLGKPSTVGGCGSATVGREVTCRLWSGGRMGSSLSIMGAGKAAERWELLPCPCGHGARNSATVVLLAFLSTLACFTPDDEQ